jgi:integrase
VEGWAANQKWAQTTKRYALTVVGGVLKWAVQTKRLPTNPLTDLKKPAGRSRGANILIEADLHQRILAVVSPQFAQFLTAVQGTGARPGEVAKVEAKDCIWDASCWLLANHKTAKRTGRERVIHLPEPVLALCRTLAEAHPTGPLFRTTRGDQWRKESWKQAMERAQKKLGLAKRPMTSGYRHQMATDLLAAGVSDAVVAEVLGHQSTAMVHKHYGHLGAKAKVMAEAVKKVRK